MSLYGNKWQISAHQHFDFLYCTVLHRDEAGLAILYQVLRFIHFFRQGAVFSSSLQCKMHLHGNRAVAVNLSHLSYRQLCTYIVLQLTDICKTVNQLLCCTKHMCHLYDTILAVLRWRLHYTDWHMVTIMNLLRTLRLRSCWCKCELSNADEMRVL